jgi:hypothetical protein
MVVPTRSASVIVVAMVVVLIAGSQGPVLASPVLAIKPGDTLLYAYTIFTTYATPNGNISRTQRNEFTVNILNVQTGSSSDIVEYSELVTLFNNTAVSNPQSAQNITTVFDPYDNNTYLGNIGFYPFTYTDLPAGSADNLNVSLPINGAPTGNITGNQMVDAIVVKEPGAINVNFTIYSGPSVEPSLTVMSFNSTDGVLTKGVTYTHFFDVEKIFTYNLLSYSQKNPSKPNSLLAYVTIAAVVAALSIIVVVAVVKWPSARSRRVAKIRKKYTGRG